MPHEDPTIPHEEPAMPSEHPAEHPTVQNTPLDESTDQASRTAVQTPSAATYEPVAEEEWLEDPPESELPRRPRHRLLGAGGNPVPLALIGLLLVACGFIGGVLVEKGQSSPNPSTGGAAGLASRFAALRGSAAGGGTRSGSSAAALGGAAGAGFTRPTAGTVAYLAGDTLYVTNAEGNTIKVTTSAATSVNKTVKSAVKSIHPGETVTITGETGSDGSVSAESISVGSSGGGLAALFGGGGARSGSSGGTHGGSGGGGEPALFGG
jgi:hypothetical protein